MKKIQASQARATVGGGFFKSLVKISTGAAILSTGGTAVLGTIGAGASTKVAVNLR